jgi:hypothetical protein
LVGLFAVERALGIVTKIAYQCLKRPKRFAFPRYHWPREALDQVQKTIVEATNLEMFDITSTTSTAGTSRSFDFPEGSHFDITVMATAENQKELAGEGRSHRRGLRRQRRQVPSGLTSIGTTAGREHSSPATPRPAIGAREHHG